MSSYGKKRRRIVIAAVGVIVLIFLSIFLVGNTTKSQTQKVGFIMIGSMDASGWDKMQYDGVKCASNKLGMELLVEENVKEFSGECEEAIRRLVKQNASVIILSSYGYSEEVLGLVQEFPEIVFYTSSSEHLAENMTSYFARMYQARYLSGIVAGMKTENGKVGYVAAMPNNEVNRGINAFTLGVRRVRPDAEVAVAWTGAWNDAEKEMETANYLIEQGADVLTYHQDPPNVIQAAEAAGVYSIGYHEAIEGCSEKYLTSVVCNWELIYEEILRGFLIGQGNIRDNYWIGLEAGAVELSAYSEEVTSEIQEEVEKAKAEILSGKDVFSGMIYDTEGLLRCREKEVIGDEVLLEQFDWYVEGVKLYEK